MDGGHDDAAVLAVMAARQAEQARVKWSVDVAVSILRRTVEGVALRSICRQPGMPAFRTVSKWIAEKPDFAAQMQEARVAAGRSFVGRTSSFCEETAELIYERLCAGEAMVSICRDPDLPVVSTVYKWMKDIEPFREAVRLAREIQAERLGAEAWEMAGKATGKTAYLTDVKLKHLRWYVGKLSPRVYGPTKATEPAAAFSGLVVNLRTFWVEERPDGWRRVRSSYADPMTRKIIEEAPKEEEWEPPPDGRRMGDW